MSALNRARRNSYRVGRVLGDVSAVASGNPRRVMKRAANKIVGRTVVRKMWFR